METPPPDTVDRIRTGLLAFYDQKRRALPWRSQRPDPYAVWVSEIMLQQTRVETVIPYYLRWMERFPDLRALADAELEEVLGLWAGLGYYSRARNLHRAARVVREDRGGRLPDTADGLRALPGIGAYTAGAIASIAYGHAEPAVDGNVRRVLSRLLDLPDPTPRHLESLARTLVDPERAGDFNQALMELGATVCTPRAPRCDACPVASECAALAAGTVDLRPAPKRPTKVRSVEFGVVVPVRNGGDGEEFWLVRRPEEGLLGGMWEFPAVEGVTEARPLLDAVAERFRWDPALRPVAELNPVPHLFSHLKARYHPILARVGHESGDEMRMESDADGSVAGRWVKPDALDDVPLPVAQQKIARAAVARLRRAASGVVQSVVLSAAFGAFSLPGATGVSAQEGWRAESRLPAPVTNNAVVGVVTSQGPSLFSFAGLDTTKIWSGVSNAAYRWDVESGEGWREIEPVPGPGRLASTAQAVGGRVYVFGGYTVAESGAERSLPDVAIYDPESEAWSFGAPMPVPVDDVVSGILGPDSLIVLISGWHDRGNEPNVQLYDPREDRWVQATEIPGAPVFGHTGAIAERTAVYVDGAAVVEARPRFQLDGSSWAGVFDPADPSQVEWVALPAHPGPPLYRAAGGVVGSMVVFAGGTDNAYNYNGIGYDGRPAQPRAEVFGYDVTAGEWVDLTPLLEPTMDHRSLVTLAGRVYLIGGMRSGQRVSDGVLSISVEDLRSAR